MGLLGLLQYTQGIVYLGTTKWYLYSNIPANPFKRCCPYDFHVISLCHPAWAIMTFSQSVCHPFYTRGKLNIFPSFLIVLTKIAGFKNPELRAVVCMRFSLFTVGRLPRLCCHVLRMFAKHEVVRYQGKGSRCRRLDEVAKRGRNNAMRQRARETL